MTFCRQLLSGIVYEIDLLFARCIEKTKMICMLTFINKYLNVLPLLVNHNAIKFSTELTGPRALSMDTMKNKPSEKVHELLLIIPL